MIVDYILDRRDGTRYCAREFYCYCLGYINSLGDDITRAMDYGTNEQVQAALCRYIKSQNYDTGICEYILTKNWIEDDPLNPMCKECWLRGIECSGTSETVWTGCARKNYVGDAGR